MVAAEHERDGTEHHESSKASEVMARGDGRSALENPSRSSDCARLLTAAASPRLRRVRRSSHERSASEGGAGPPGGQVVTNSYRWRQAFGRNGGGLRIWRAVSAQAPAAGTGRDARGHGAAAGALCGGATTPEAIVANSYEPMRRSPLIQDARGLHRIHGRRRHRQTARPSGSSIAAAGTAATTMRPARCRTSIRFCTSTKREAAQSFGAG
jgi:hypothetical protein